MNANNLIGKYRLILTEYFDSVTSQIDLFIETQLEANWKDEAKSVEINTKRGVLGSADLMTKIRFLFHANTYLR
jgi:hypothetical protein